MLKKIKIENINAIGTMELELKKDRYNYLTENVLDGYVNPVAIYGHNGSGKSSLIYAIKQFVFMMIAPVDNITPFVVNNFNFEKFKNNAGDSELITGSILLIFSLDNDEYEYYLSTSREGFIVEEYLKMNDDNIFLRDKNKENYLGEETFFVEGRSKLIPSIRFLASEMVNNVTIQKVYSYLSNLTVIESNKINSDRTFVTSKNLENVKKLELLTSKSNEVKDILRKYEDFPVYSIVKKDNSSQGKEPDYAIKYDDLDEALPIEFMSDGMKSQSYMLSIILALPSNAVVFIDEIEQALHPTTLMSFIKIVREKKMQLVFSSHNTHILKSLRPDQVYFAKWKKGYSTISRLSNIYPNIREVNNLEKMYLNSLFDEEINEE